MLMGGKYTCLMYIGSIGKVLFGNVIPSFNAYESFASGDESF